MTRRMLTIYLLIVSFILAQAPTHLRAQTASMTYAQVMAGSRLNPLVNVANDNCDTAEPALFSKQSLDEIAQIACANAIASAPVTESLIDGLLQSAGQCAVGIGETAVDIIEGVGAAIKMVVVETPTCAYQVTRNAVLRAYRAAKDAFGMASDAADANVSAQETCIDRAVVALSNISEIKQVIADQINLQFKQFQCMPAAQQSKMLCKLIAGVFASVVSPHMVYAAGAKAVSAARTSVEIVRKTTELMNAMKTEFGGPGVTVGETLDRATSAIHASASTNVRLRTRGHELYRFSDSKVVEYISPKGEKILELEEVVTLANGKRAMVPVGELGIDAVTSLIKSSDGRGREVLGKLIAANSNQGAILFLDVNNLGKVNYFAGKSAAGDQYLAAVAKALKESIRPEDVAFRHGGDELVAFIHTTNPERIKQIAANIQNKIDRDPGLRQLFIEEVKQYTDAARAVRSSKSFNDLPDSVRVRLSEDQIRLAHRDYRGFQNTVFDEFIAAAQDQSRYRPSASIGTTLLGNDTLETAILRADTQSAQVKALYKEASGLDASKYMTSRTQNTSARPDPRARPPIFDPVPAP